MRGSSVRRGARVPSQEGGAATVETVGVFTIAAILVLAVLVAVAPSAPVLGQTYAYWICRITTLGQGSCGGTTSADDHQPTQPCVTQSDGVERTMKVSAIVFTAQDGRRVETSRLSDGRYRVTISDTRGAGLETGVGAGLSISVNDRTVGGKVTADVGASLDFTSGDVYYADQDGITDLLDAVQQDQVKDAVAGDRGVTRWIADRATDLAGTSNVLPSADETFAEGGVSLNASAEATGQTTSARAGLETAQVLGVRSTKDGGTTVFLKSSVAGEAGLSQLGIDTSGPQFQGPQFQGAKLGGRVELVNAVTFDSLGNIVSVQVTAVAAGTSTGVAAALFGDAADPSLDNQVSGTRLWTATLPIKDRVDLDVAGRYLAAQGVVAVGAWTNPVIAGAGAAAVTPTSLGFFAAARDRGITTRQDFETDDTTVLGVDATGKLGVELGVTADVSTDSMTSTGGQYWDGRQWVDWTGCAR